MGHSGMRPNTLDLVNSPGSGRHQKKTPKKRNYPGSPMNGMKTQRKVAMTKIVLYDVGRRENEAPRQGATN